MANLYKTDRDLRYIVAQRPGEPDVLLVVNQGHRADDRLPVNLYSYGVFLKNAQGHWYIDHWFSGSMDIVGINNLLIALRIYGHYEDHAWQPMTLEQLTWMQRFGSLTLPEGLILHGWSSDQDDNSLRGFSATGQQYLQVRCSDGGATTCDRCGKRVPTAMLACDNGTYDNTEMVCFEHVTRHCHKSVPCLVCLRS